MNIVENIILSGKKRKKEKALSTGRGAGLDVGIRTAEKDLELSPGNIPSTLFVRSVKQRLLSARRGFAGLIE